jgi:threonine synthase
LVALLCKKCAFAYPRIGLPHVCPQCGGLFDFDRALDFSIAHIETELPGIWRYRHAFSLFEGAPVVSLGEGNTPLLWLDVEGKRVGVKMEGQNPSGSFKDRGVAVTISQLLARGVHSAVEDSSGNAGASFAAYAAAAGVKARVFVPESAGGAKCQQIAAYGAELVRVTGPRSAAAEAALAEVAAGSFYASHAYLPFGLAGYATIAYEVFEAMQSVPGTVIAPVGHGGLLLGLVRGFQALKDSGAACTLPRFVGVQAANCAPVYAAFQEGQPAVESVVEGKTIAGGVAVRDPKQLPALLAEIPQGSRMAAITEEDILPAARELAGRGLFVEPSSALTWAALKQLIEVIPEPVVLILSGNGLKQPF